MIAFLSSDHFSHSKAAAVNTTRRARAKRAEAGPISEEWDIEDHLTALNARISPLKSIGTELLDAGIRVYRALWPNSVTPVSISELSKCLLAAETRLREWRSSSARAGADQALTFVLSWYESINLDAVRSLRQGSKWTSDPTLIASRKEAASFMASYAPTRHFLPGPAYSEDEEDDEDDEEGEDEEDDVDEEIEVEAPDTATAGATETAATGATDTAKPTATDTSEKPVSDTSVEPSTEISPEARTDPTAPSSSEAAA